MPDRRGGSGGAGQGGGEFSPSAAVELPGMTSENVGQGAAGGDRPAPGDLGAELVPEGLQVPPSPAALMAELLRSTPRRVIAVPGSVDGDVITVRVPYGPPIATAETYRGFLAILVELTHVEILDVPDPRGTG